MEREFAILEEHLRRAGITAAMPQSPARDGDALGRCQLCHSKSALLGDHYCMVCRTELVVTFIRTLIGDNTTEPVKRGQRVSDVFQFDLSAPEVAHAGIRSSRLRPEH